MEHQVRDIAVLCLLATAFVIGCDETSSKPSTAGKPGGSSPAKAKQGQVAPSERQNDAKAKSQQTDVQQLVPIDQLIKLLNDPNNTELLSVGDQLGKHPPSALPKLYELRDREDLSWVADVAIRKAIERIEHPEWEDKLPPHLQKRLDWYNRTTVGAYERVGRKDKKWDRVAKEGLGITAKRWSGGRVERLINHERRWTLWKAVDSGCDDPLVLWCYKLSEGLKNAGSDRQHRDWLTRAGRGMMKIEYPPIRRIQVLSQFAIELVRPADRQHVVTDADRSEAAAAYEKIVELLPLALADPELPRDNALQYIRRSLFAGKYLTSRANAFERIRPIVAEAYKGTNFPLILDGAHSIDLGWDARGVGTADTVTDDGWRLLREHALAAKELLLKAQDMDDSDVLVCRLLMTVGMALGRDHLSMIQDQFRRAIRIDPDSEMIYDTYMFTIEPKWYGDPEQYLRFGRLCLLTGNWEAGLPLYLLKAHHTLGTEYYPPRPRAPALRYLASNGVWDSYEAVCDEWLKRYPKDHWVSQRYARAACATGRWKLANRILTQWNESDYYNWSTRDEWDSLTAKAKELGSN